MTPVLRTLLIEDSADIQIIVRLTLETTGHFTVATCSSGEEALEVLAEGLPDLVLLDVMMPGMDGIETLRRLRELPGAATLPVIFMTAKVLEHEMTAYRGLGALGVIGKPFDPVELPDEIQLLWNGRAGAEPAGDTDEYANGVSHDHGKPRALAPTG